VCVALCLRVAVPGDAVNLYFDRNGEPMTVEAWASSLEKNRRVAETTLPDGTWISTVWLGMNHRYAGDGPPLIFESMAFDKDGVGDQDCERWSTEAEARAGHEAMVARWMAKSPPPPSP